MSEHDQHEQNRTLDDAHLAAEANQEPKSHIPEFPIQPTLDYWNYQVFAGSDPEAYTEFINDHRKMAMGFHPNECRVRTTIRHKGYECKIIADSLSPAGKRLTTVTIKYPRFVHSEVLTHRDRARNSASSRAIPFAKLLNMVVTEPVIPVRWGAEQKGMQTGDEILHPEEATKIWLAARDDAVGWATKLHSLGVHKSLCNRLIEPWMWITVVMTATEWQNLFRLRCHPDAEINFQKIACMLKCVLDNSKPTPVDTYAWHLPFIQEDERETLEIETLKKVSVARCARVSYLTHEGTREIPEDLKLFDKLVQGSGFGHWSPHEHVAKAMPSPNFHSGPFKGWAQYRKHFVNENADEQGPTK